MKENIFEIPKSNESGIYMIYNVDKHKAYIGQTNNFKRRATMHRQQLLSGKHSNNEMQKDFDNGDRFAFAILEFKNKDDDLLLIEKQYIYAFRDKSIKTYNKETNEQIKHTLFYAMILPEIARIHKNFHSDFGCELAQIPYCKYETIVDKCSQQKESH